MSLLNRKKIKKKLNKVKEWFKKEIENINLQDEANLEAERIIKNRLKYPRIDIYHFLNFLEREHKSNNKTAYCARKIKYSITILCDGSGMIECLRLSGKFPDFELSTRKTVMKFSGIIDMKRLILEKQFNIIISKKKMYQELP